MSLPAAWLLGARIPITQLVPVEELCSLRSLSSYGSGTSATPLLGDTIGDNLARTVSRVPGAEALVDVPSGRRWTYDLRDVVYIGEESWDRLVAAGAGGSADSAVPAARLTELSKRMATLSPDDPINIQYTSGTAGFPKGATLSHHNILNNGFFVGELVYKVPRFVHVVDGFPMTVTGKVRKVEMRADAPEILARAGRHS